MIQIGASSATIDTPVEHLMACHRRIEQRLDTLARAAEHLESNRAAALEGIARSLEFLNSSGALHTEDEENSFFPRLRAKLSPDQIGFLDSLEQQHGEAESILARLKLLVDRAVGENPVPPALVEEYRDCAEQLRSLYRAHIQSEDEILTAMARQSLSEPELTQISGEMRQRRKTAGKL